MSRRGFTLIEIIVVIAVIALLATVGAVSYRGIHKRAAVATLSKDLTAAADSVETALIRHREMPSVIPESFRASDGVTVAMSGSTLPFYDGLSAVQNGVLFYEICGDLVAEGYARGVNKGGQQEQYITACNVYNHPQLQVNSSWSGRNFSTPVSSSALPNVVDAINYHDSWRPDRDAIEKLFYQTWHDRFTAMGGTYPVTSFWDSWASPGNGVMREELPEPRAGLSKDYCIEAIHELFPDMVYHITRDGNAPVAGACA